MRWLWLIPLAGSIIVILTLAFSALMSTASRQRPVAPIKPYPEIGDVWESRFAPIPDLDPWDERNNQQHRLCVIDVKDGWIRYKFSNRSSFMWTKKITELHKHWVLVHRENKETAQPYSISSC